SCLRAAGDVTTAYVYTYFAGGIIYRYLLSIVQRIPAAAGRGQQGVRIRVSAQYPGIVTVAGGIRYPEVQVIYQGFGGVGSSGRIIPPDAHLQLPYAWRYGNGKALAAALRGGAGQEAFLLYRAYGAERIYRAKAAAVVHMRGAGIVCAVDQQG